VSAVADPAIVPELAFAVCDAAAQESAAVPTLRLSVRVERVDGGAVRAVALQTQIRIAAPRRDYDAATQARLAELFGPSEQWSRSLRSLLWTQATTMIGPFDGATTIALLVPCTYDFDVAAAKYLHALRDGSIPLELLFSGTVFAPAAAGGLQVTHIGSGCEATFSLPVRVWRDTIERTFGDQAWLRMDRDAFERLAGYRAAHGFGTWEATVDALLREARA
jgi:hypothetical protein